MIKASFMRLSRANNLEMPEERCSFSQDNRKRKEKLKPITKEDQVHTKFDNPFILKGK